MTQYARPDSDVSDGNWLNSAGNNTNLYSYVDESSVNDSDYIYAVDQWGSTEICILGLGDVTDPSSAADHKITVRALETVGFGGVDLNVILQQGTTTIRSHTFNPSTGFANYTTTLTSSQANAITDYSDLRLKISATDQMGSSATTQVSWAYFECPDAASSAVSNPAFLLFVD